MAIGVFASRLKGGRKNLFFHVILRNPPEYECSRFETVEKWALRLARLAQNKTFNVRFYTDTPPLSDAYAKILPGTVKVRTLPTPVCLAPSLAKVRPPGREGIRIGVMGGVRKEKGGLLLPDIFRLLPGFVDGKRVSIAIQYRPDQEDLDIRSVMDGIQKAYGADAGHPACILLAGSYSGEEYAELFAGLDLSLLLYTSERYRASSSGVMIEAIHFATPVITFADSWMGGVVASALAQGFRIGAAITGLAELPGAFRELAGDIARHKRDLTAFADIWRKVHNPDAYFATLLEE
ncbi:MAG: hypothetical protein LBU23_02385 [Planctomycetota bacterium]|nr:hypothetical protein [Planctomycetota bacterium]